MDQSAGLPTSRRETFREKLTSTGVDKLAPPASGQQFVYDTEVKQFGVRLLPSGKKAFIVNVMHEGKFYRRTLGDTSRMSADEARRKARVVLVDIEQGRDPKRQKDERKQREAAEKQARAEAERERIAVEQQTLRRLCGLYVDDLKRRGKSAARDALSMFKTHVYDEPEASRPAGEIKQKDITSILRQVIDKGHGRTAAKLRSYLRAAYQRALTAEGDATVGAELLAFSVETNPVASTKSLSQFTRARGRKLSEAEFAQTMRRLAADKGLPARVARLCVLLGGQRPAQLLRAKVEDFRESEKLLLLLDGKGRRKEPRVHAVPVIGPALPIVKALADEARLSKEGWLFSSDGKTAMRTETANSAVVDISDALIAEAKTAGAKEPEPFSLRDLRAAVETQLSALGVSKDVRAQLLSHGLGGVQDTHYNYHDYLPEKLSALRLLHVKIAKLTKSKRK